MGTIIVPNHLERGDVAKAGKHVDRDFDVANHTVPHFETIRITQNPGGGSWDQVPRGNTRIYLYTIVHQLKSTWHSPNVLVYMGRLLTMPCILTTRYYFLSKNTRKYIRNLHGHMGVSKNRGCFPQKWMVYNEKPYKNG